jgi:hypothetical protein
MMYTNLNPRTMGLNHHPYEDLLAAAGKCGFGGIEVPAHAFGSVEKAREPGNEVGIDDGTLRHVPGGG